MSQAFDDFADRYQAAVDQAIAFAGTEHDFFVKQKVSALLELAGEVDDPARLRVLDVGCGPGVFGRHLVDDVAELHGVDVSEPMVERAARDNPKGLFRTFDGETLPHEAGSLDVAFAVCVFHHVDPPKRPRLASEMARVVRPGGIVAIFEHNPWNPLTRLVVRRCEFDDGVRLLPLRDGSRLLRDAQLAAPSSRYLIFLPRPTPTLDRVLAHVPVGAQYVVHARKP